MALLLSLPEADADGRPVDFVGAYILDSTIAFPQAWNHDSTNSTALIKGRNLLIGTGGISGISSLVRVPKTSFLLNATPASGNAAAGVITCGRISYMEAKSTIN